MDCSKVGKLILSLRRERGWTQKQLADALNLSDRTVSKWERGLGCPDVSLLRELSAVLAVDIEKILLGDLQPNDEEVGNMKKLKFYVCPNCGSALFAMGEAEISCCGRRLQPLEALRLVQAAGGVAVMAHPVQAGHDEIIPDLAAAGLSGLECRHPDQPAGELQKHYLQLAADLGLAVSAGSDCHDGGLGDFTISGAELLKLLKIQ